MANDHPFQLLFETLGRIPAAHAESVNRRAYDILSDMLTAPVEKAGRCILLRAPRAGHGKTHLLSRVQHYLGSTHEFIPLHPGFGCRIDAASVTDDALRRLVRPLPASGGLCVLDLVTRRLFAIALQPLVASGEVPCQDREGALTALRNRPIETFDFHHPNAVTAHWARENFEVLGQRLSLELAQNCGLPVREVSFWVEALFRFSATPVENSGRVRALAESVHAGNPAENEAMERLESLLGLLSLLMRVVLVADDLEGFSADETAALRLAAFLGSLRQSVERLDVILSLNQDVWQSAFLPRLSGGLADRLSEIVIELDPLTETEMVALLDSRVPGLGSRVLEKIDVSTTGTHARGLIRAAGMAWLKATAMDSAPSAILAAVPEVKRAEIETVAEIPQPEPVIVVPAVEPPLAPPEVATAPVQEEPTSWPAPQFYPNPITSETGLNSPFQVENPVFTPEPSPAQNWQDAPQNVPASNEQSAPAAQFLSEPVVSYQPQLDSPFQVSPSVSSPEPAPVFQFNPPASESPFQVAPDIFSQDPPAAFSPPQNMQEASPAVSSFGNGDAPAATFQPQADSPFQIAPQDFAPEPAPPFEFNPPPAAHFQPESAPSLQPNEPPIFASPHPPAEPTQATAAPDTDRVDDLLRQFRERYGRGSL